MNTPKSQVRTFSNTAAVVVIEAKHRYLLLLIQHNQHARSSASCCTWWFWLGTEFLSFLTPTETLHVLPTTDAAEPVLHWQQHCHQAAHHQNTQENTGELRNWKWLQQDLKPHGRGSPRRDGERLLNLWQTPTAFFLCVCKGFPPLFIPILYP